MLLLCLGTGSVWGADITYTFTSKDWAATSGGSTANWTSGKDGGSFSNNGIQCSTNEDNNNAYGTSPSSFTDISQIIVTYNTNKGQGAGKLKIKIGTNDEVSNDVAYSGSDDGRTANFTTTFTFSPAQTGSVRLTINTTINSLYVVSVAITYGSVSTYTATWHVNGDDDYHSQTAAAGTTLTAPATTPTSSDCDNSKVFMGWSASEIDGTTNTEPVDLFTDPTTKKMPAADIGYYAVFATRTGTAPVYTKVNSVSAGTYVLVSEKPTSTYKYLPNATATSNPQLKGGITLTTVAGVTTLTNTVKDSMLWDLTSTGTANQYYIRPHDSTSIGLGTLPTTGDKIRITTDYKDTKWTITTRETYNWQFVNNNATPKYLAVYNESEWRCYDSNATNQNGNFYLFKQSGGYSYSAYATSCAACAADPTAGDASLNGSVLWAGERQNIQSCKSAPYTTFTNRAEYVHSALHSQVPKNSSFSLFILTMSKITDIYCYIFFRYKPRSLRYLYTQSKVRLMTDFLLKRAFFSAFQQKITLLFAQVKYLLYFCSRKF